MKTESETQLSRVDYEQPLAGNLPAVDLSTPDNSEYAVGRPHFIWLLWHFIGSPLVRSNSLPIPRLKAAVLRLFGAKVGRRAHIKPSVKVKFPWYLEIGDYCWIGEEVWIDNLAPVTIGSHVCVSQGAYLCTGNHDWKTTNLKLFRRPIVLKDGCWIGARSVVGPGVTIGAAAVVAIGGVALKDIPPYEVWGGNPAQYVRRRILRSPA